MKEQTKEYSNGEVTIVWKPHLCIHSENCFRGLPRVFNPKRRPWIAPEAATSQKIVDQVAQCPSGALSTYMNQNQNKEMENTAESPKPQVEVMSMGPLKVEGPVSIKMKDGSIVTREKAAFLCRCGQSTNKPFCDGSHKKVDFDPD